MVRKWCCWLQAGDPVMGQQGVCSCWQPVPFCPYCCPLQGTLGRAMFHMRYHKIDSKIITSSPSLQAPMHLCVRRNVVLHMLPLWDTSSELGWLTMPHLPFAPCLAMVCAVQGSSHGAEQSACGGFVGQPQACRRFWRGQSQHRWFGHHGRKEEGLWWK